MQSQTKHLRPSGGAARLFELFQPELIAKPEHQCRSPVLRYSLAPLPFRQFHELLVGAQQPNWNLETLRLHSVELPEHLHVRLRGRARRQTPSALRCLLQVLRPVFFAQLRRGLL